MEACNYNLVPMFPYSLSLPKHDVAKMNSIVQVEDNFSWWIVFDNSRQVHCISNFLYLCEKIKYEYTSISLRAQGM